MQKITSNIINWNNQRNIYITRASKIINSHKNWTSSKAWRWHPYEQCSHEIFLGGNPVVNGSETIEFVPIYSIDNCTLWILSFTTKNLMSICFDFVKFLLLLDYNTVDLLSQNSLNGLLIPSTIRSLVTNFAVMFHD